MKNSTKTDKTKKNHFVSLSGFMSTFVSTGVSPKLFPPTTEPIAMMSVALRLAP
jgi:hypothetical protein